MAGTVPQSKENLVDIELEQAANALKEVIRFMPAEVGLKVALEDEVDAIQKSTEYLLDQVDSLDSRSRTKFVIAYKEFLLRITKYIDSKLNQTKSHK